MRLQIQIFPAQPGPVGPPVCSFLEIASPSLSLEDLSISIQNRYCRLYPQRPELNIHKLQDYDSNDLDLSYTVADVFSDKSANKNDSIVRVIQLSNARDSSLPPESALKSRSWCAKKPSSFNRPALGRVSKEPPRQRYNKSGLSNDTTVEDSEQENGHVHHHGSFLGDGSGKHGRANGVHPESGQADPRRHRSGPSPDLGVNMPTDIEIKVEEMRDENPIPSNGPSKDTEMAGPLPADRLSSVSGSNHSQPASQPKHATTGHLQKAFSPSDSRETSRSAKRSRPKDVYDFSTGDDEPTLPIAPRSSAPKPKPRKRIRYGNSPPRRGMSAPSEHLEGGPSTPRPKAHKKRQIPGAKHATSPAKKSASIHKQPREDGPRQPGGQGNPEHLQQNHQEQPQSEQRKEMSDANNTQETELGERQRLEQEAKKHAEEERRREGEAAEQKKREAEEEAARARAEARRLDDEAVELQKRQAEEAVKALAEAKKLEAEAAELQKRRAEEEAAKAAAEEQKMLLNAIKEAEIKKLKEESLKEQEMIKKAVEEADRKEAEERKQKQAREKAAKAAADREKQRKKKEEAERRKTKKEEELRKKKKLEEEQCKKRAQDELRKNKEEEAKQQAKQEEERRKQEEQERRQAAEHERLARETAEKELRVAELQRQAEAPKPVPFTQEPPPRAMSVDTVTKENTTRAGSQDRIMNSRERFSHMIDQARQQSPNPSNTLSQTPKKIVQEGKKGKTTKVVKEKAAEIAKRGKSSKTNSSLALGNHSQKRRKWSPDLDETPPTTSRQSTKKKKRMSSSPSSNPKNSQVQRSTSIEGDHEMAPPTPNSGVKRGTPKPAPSKKRPSASSHSESSTSHLLSSPTPNAPPPSTAPAALRTQVRPKSTSRALAVLPEETGITEVPTPKLGVVPGSAVPILETDCYDVPGNSSDSKPALPPVTQVGRTPSPEPPANRAEEPSKQVDAEPRSDFTVTDWSVSDNEDPKSKDLPANGRKPADSDREMKDVSRPRINAEIVGMAYANDSDDDSNRPPPSTQPGSKHPLIRSEPSDNGSEESGDGELSHAADTSSSKGNRSDQTPGATQSTKSASRKELQYKSLSDLEEEPLAGSSHVVADSEPASRPLSQAPPTQRVRKDYASSSSDSDSDSSSDSDSGENEGARKDKGKGKAPITPDPSSGSTPTATPDPTQTAAPLVAQAGAPSASQAVQPVQPFSVQVLAPKKVGTAKSLTQTTLGFRAFGK